SSHITTIAVAIPLRTTCRLRCLSSKRPNAPTEWFKKTEPLHRRLRSFAQKKAPHSRGFFMSIRISCL
ncbi:hypothetical protein M1M11_28820, partial [Pseudomonas azerbaijanoccidens]|uniref:hypothetical protein n=1 Tax=Pseudomonas azerbaijanoccidentalis TaxID=2842347 RepID=UPI00200B0AFE